jgi:hypothetical protein
VVPHLARWFVKPKVTLIPGVSVEIGFTALGPLFNPSLAFRSQRQGALITAIAFDVTHERGQTATFVAQQLVETAGSTQNTAGDFALHQRVQSVIAVVMVPTQIAERKVNCRASTVISRHDNLVANYQNAVRRLRDSDVKKWAESTAACAEYDALRKFWIGESFWHTGNYKVVVRAMVDELKREVTTKFSFALTDEHLRFLESNSTGLEWEAKGIFSDIAQVPRDPERFAWQWVYPAIRA